MNSFIKNHCINTISEGITTITTITTTTTTTVAVVTV